MKTLLIIHRRQFGYEVCAFELSKTLKKYFKITFLCFDSNLPKYENDSINVIYVSSKGNFLVRGIRFVNALSNELNKNYNYVYLFYFNFCSLSTFFTKIKITLDFRTGSVAKNRLVRKFDNMFRRFEAKRFLKISVISEGLKQQLKISQKNSIILPLGANIISSTPKRFDEPRLLYLGTFHNRRIEDTIIGLYKFLESNPVYKTSLTYDIVGDGYGREEEEIKLLVSKYSLSNNVIIHGRKKHNEIIHLFDNCNIGVSYIPITSYFTYQPPTKTFEYIMSGMLCLGTETCENKNYLEDSNGILCMDNPESFALGIEKCILKFNSINSQEIRSTLIDYSWENISKQLKEFLQNGR